MSIPKIIHYAWLSNDPWDDIHKKCFQSWTSVLADYTFMLWDLSKTVPADFFKKMVRQKKWAFASDYIRLYGLAQYGGIYLDLDVEVIKNFDSILQNTCILGREDEQLLACHFIASEKEHPFILECLKFYDDSIKLKLSSPPTMPRIITKRASKYGLNKEDTFQKLKNNITIYPARYFSPLHYTMRLYKNPQQFVEKETFCIHYWSHSWSWLGSGSILKYLKNQPWLFMNLNDWRRFFKMLLRKIKSGNEIK